MGTHSHGAEAHALHGTDSRRTFVLALSATAAFAVVEFFGGWYANSLALMGDAGHMITDSGALALGAVAAAVSRIGTTGRYTYGLQRAEVIGALINVLFMYGVVALIGTAAIERLRNPPEVAGPVVIVIATLGLGVNLLVMHILHRGEKTLNTRGAMLHVLGDLLGSVAAITAGVTIWLSGWTPIDPLLSLLICLLILVSSTRLLMESLTVVMEGIPDGMSVDSVENAMVESGPQVIDVHDLHIWTLSSRMTAMSAHIVITDMRCWPVLSEELHRMLEERFDIHHATLQPEIGSTDPRCLHSDCVCRNGGQDAKEQRL